MMGLRTLAMWLGLALLGCGSASSLDPDSAVSEAADGAAAADAFAPDDAPSGEDVQTPLACANVPMLPPTPNGDPYETDLALGTNDLSGSCGGGDTPELVYSFDGSAGGGPGATIYLRVSSANGHKMYIRTDCAEPTTEALCSELPDIGYKIEKLPFYVVFDGPPGPLQFRWYVEIN